MKTLDITTLHGPMRVIEEDIWISSCLRETGQHSSSELAMIQLVLGLQTQGRYDGVVVDGGAYIGDLTIPLSRLAKTVYAFEPHPEIREILCHNLEINHCTNVEVMPWALGDKTMEIPIELTHIDRQGLGAGQVSPGGTQVGTGDGIAQMRTLDDLCLSPDFIKADIEGMEIPLLAGALRTLRDHRPALFLEYDTVIQVDLKPLPEVLEMLGYKPYPMQFPMAGQGAPARFASTVAKMMLAVPAPGRRVGEVE